MSALEQQIGKLCAKCPARVMLKYGRYCDPCRAKARVKRPKYAPNDLVDQKLKAIYLTPDKKRNSGQSAKRLAAQIGWPVWALRKRAASLGIARVKDLPWNEHEIAILERFAWRSPSSIRLKLKAAGFSRTATAIDIKLDRTHARLNTPYFTATGLGTLLGIDAHCVTRWIKLGYLKAQMRGTERHGGNGGDMYMIHENDFRRFVCARPLEFDLRKVDQLWFLDFITQGKIAS